MERSDKMQKIAYYNSPVGQILLASDEQACGFVVIAFMLII